MSSKKKARTSLALASIKRGVIRMTFEKLIY